MKFIMLIHVKMPTIVDILTFISMINTTIHVKMPTIVGILTFISMINTTSECWKASKVFIFQHFSFNEQLTSCSVELSMKKVYNLGACFFLYIPLL